jgi:hypothetical protein
LPTTVYVSQSRHSTEHARLACDLLEAAGAKLIDASDLLCSKQQESYQGTLVCLTHSCFERTNDLTVYKQVLSGGGRIITLNLLGGASYIGPLAHRRESPCANCLRTRIAQYFAPRTNRTAKRGEHGPRYVTTEVLAQVLSGVQQLESEDFLVVHDMKTEIRSGKILRVNGCPFCRIIPSAMTRETH